ncbi:type I secretion system permease/ATPase [Flavimaricola marinus]|uniref:Type I secretion system ATP-binding protein PrsD n=1 Tax=Flavimaricola marinus TaxID=1819565 RepID=A0A238LID2_9RHOB|nr:type I secretion system permease/ATPase [Flavimaricola marinus]SMY09303.1 Type I secretion system ATP-binding protein PrsD [Flavimaricola marinus]
MQAMQGHKSDVIGAVGDPYRTALKRLRPSLIVVVLLSAAVNLLALTGSIYMLQVYDRVLSSRSVQTLVGLFVIVVVLYSFFALFDALRARFLSRAALRLDNDLAGAAFRIALLPGADKVQATALANLNVLRGFLSSAGATTIADLPFMPLFMTVLFLIHPWLGFLTIGGAAVVCVIALINRAVTAPSLSRSLTLDAQERGFSVESSRSADAVRAMRMQTAVTGHWLKLHKKALASGQSGNEPSEVLAASSRSFRMLLQSSILTLGAYLVLLEQISPGMIIASSILAGRALAPVDQLIGHWRTIARSLTAHRHLAAAFAALPQGEDAIELPAPKGHVSVRKLTKLGADASGVDPRRIVSDASFSLQAGDGLGVIGASASGKTTLARLLVGATHADGGEVRLDGATLEQWPSRQLGRAIGYLPQSLELLPGTIRDNIARFDPEATDEAVIDAAMLTGIHDMIMTLPKGYATRICDAGAPSPLSGGQIQRLGLARAVFGLPALVVLDEPNANLDISGDDALARTITALRRSGSTVIVMTHRPSALGAVNKLLVLDAGRIKAFGDKDEILAAPRAAPAANAAPVPSAAPASTFRAAPPRRSVVAVAPAGAPNEARAKSRTIVKLPPQTAPQTAPHAAPQTTSRTATQPVTDPHSEPEAAAKPRARAVPMVVRKAGPARAKRQA